MDTTQTRLQADLIALLQSMRGAEQDLFARVPAEAREMAGTIGEWSPKDLLAHLGAWRAIEARRLEARAAGEAAFPAEDPPPDEPIDVSNAALQARDRDLSWEAIAAAADGSVAALIAAIERSSTNILCECDDGSVAGIGVNGVNHAVGHLPEIAELVDGGERFNEFATEVETILRAGHVPPRDSGTILYNIACAQALSGELDGARRLLGAAFARRHDLVDLAQHDPDLAALRGELTTKD